MCKARVVNIVFLLLCIHVQAADVLKGDENAADNQTFSFRVQQHELSSSAELQGTNFYVAAHPDDGGTDVVKEFAVSRVSRDTEQFVGLTTQKARVNLSSERSASPLYDQGIAFFSLFDGANNILAGMAERPVVVTNADRKTIYLINNYFDVKNDDGKLEKTSQILSADAGQQNIPDTTAAVTAGIVQIQAMNPHVFAAVRPSSGSFGDVGSGIAMVMVGTLPVAGGSFTGPVIIDAPTGALSRAGGNRALPLDVTLSELKIGSNLASIGSVVDMCWHANVGRLYIALQVTGGAAGADGARALLVGRIGKDADSETSGDNKLQLVAIAPTAVFDGALDKIVGSQDADAQVSIHNVRPMFSSTALPYIVVVGGVGAPASTKRTVFALPIVGGSDTREIEGTIAAKSVDPVDLFTPTTVPQFRQRVIKQAATTAAQMPLSTDAATQVGGGALLNGDIVGIFVHEDTVFVSVQSAVATQTAGIFYSQAFFEANGKIKGWTTWRRADGTLNNVLGAALDATTGKSYFLAQNSADDVKIVKRTVWKSGATDGLSSVVALADSFFPKPEAGVQGVHDFVVTSVALDSATPGLLDISLLVATGYQKVLLVETSTVVSGAVVPHGGASFGPEISFTNGEITQTFPVTASKRISIEGGALDEIGPIVAAEVARDGSAGSNGWLFVGGSGGVAVLSKANGAGWNTATGLATNFTGLTAGMSFKRVGDYQQVCKLIHDDQYLYVLTETQLDRIDLTQGNVGLGIISVNTVAGVDTIPGVGAQGSLLDAVISEKLVLLATSRGLFRLANSLDVRTVDTVSASWEILSTPEDIGAIRQLIVVTQTGRAQDIARKSDGGNLYAMSAYRGKNQAKLYRFEVQQVVGSSISDTTVQRISDLYVQNISSYFANYGLFRNIFATDGALFFGTQSQSDDEHSVATILNAKGGVQTGSRFLSNKEIPVDLSESSLISSMIQSSATGSWLLVGDHGIRANE